MENNLQSVRGTKDLIGEEFLLHQYIIDTAAQIASCYNYQPIATPIFEFTSVFARSLGDTTDVVTKEMYTFIDRSGDSITLRPEFTAAIIRAYVSCGLTHQLPLKLFSTGPIFRHERPQKGRYRQFHQINFECLGVASPQMDAEIIALGAHILQDIGVLNKTILQLNSLGDKESRQAYHQALADYFRAHIDKLSADSKIRLEKNPLRILDSKDEADRKIVANAPQIMEYYTEATQEYFAKTKESLDMLGIKYQITPHLVRGLDYYCHTAFEFVTTELGAQGTVLGGGRYDGLAQIMSAPATPGIGFAAGIERLAALTSHKPVVQRPMVIFPIGEAASRQALQLAHQLRQAGLKIELYFDMDTGKRLKLANKINAEIGIFMGDDELVENVVKVKNLDTRSEEKINIADLIGYLKHE